MAVHEAGDVGFGLAVYLGKPHTHSSHPISSSLRGRDPRAFRPCGQLPASTGALRLPRPGLGFKDTARFGSENKKPGRLPGFPRWFPGRKPVRGLASEHSSPGRALRIRPRRRQSPSVPRLSHSTGGPAATHPPGSARPEPGSEVARRGHGAAIRPATVANKSRRPPLTSPWCPSPTTASAHQVVGAELLQHAVVLVLVYLPLVVDPGGGRQAWDARPRRKRGWGRAGEHGGRGGPTADPAVPRPAPTLGQGAAELQAAGAGSSRGQSSLMSPLVTAGAPAAGF